MQLQINVRPFLGEVAVEFLQLRSNIYVAGHEAPVIRRQECTTV